MKRRLFIQNISTSALFLSLGGWSFAQNKKQGKHITILHTNDTHSHIDPFPSDDPRVPNQGGIARRAVLVEQIRKENPNTLLLDAGDIFQGTPYFNYYGGELEIKLMSMLRYDAATMGNHDFDNGLDGFLAQLPHASFPFICSNYDFKNTILNGYTIPYKVFVVDGVRIGIFGLGVALKGLVDSRLYKETQYLNPLEISQDMEQKLRFEQKCDLVICLSHLGYEYKNDQVSDLILAKNSTEIDLIIGGHTHTFLPYPTIVKNKQGRDILVNQVGCYGINLGRIDFYLNTQIPTQGASIAV